MKETCFCPPVKAWLKTCQLEDSIRWTDVMVGGQKSSQTERQPLALALGTFGAGNAGDKPLPLVGNFGAIHNSINFYTSLF